MPEETLLAFDYGAKKLGVALGNTLLKQARPLDLILEATRDGRFARSEALSSTPRNTADALPASLRAVLGFLLCWSMNAAQASRLRKLLAMRPMMLSQRLLFCNAILMRIPKACPHVTTAARLHP